MLRNESVPNSRMHDWKIALNFGLMLRFHFAIDYSFRGCMAAIFRYKTIGSLKKIGPPFRIILKRQCNPELV